MGFMSIFKKVKRKEKSYSFIKKPKRKSKGRGSYPRGGYGRGGSSQTSFGGR